MSGLGKKDGVVQGPNLLVIGAPRAGTSFLWEVFRKSPEVFTPPVKEPHFHLSDQWSLGGPERDEFTKPLRAFLDGRKRKVWGGLMTDPTAYHALFEDAGAAPWRLEATPNYFAEGHAMAVRLDERLGPNCRVIVTLRDPVERAVSHYRLFRKLGWESKNFDEAISLGPERVSQGWAPTWDYLRYSQIAQPLAAWRKVFGDRLMVLTLDGMAYQPDQQLARISDWLGLEQALEAPRGDINAAPIKDAIALDAAEQIIQATGRLDLQAERATLTKAREDEPAPPLVSVGMPVRNGAASIREALGSLRRQTYQNLEIVVCDNASDDDTATIVTELAQSDLRIKLRRFEEMVGIQDSYRRALDSRRGDYFLFAPSDDTWCPDFIDAAVRKLQKDRKAAACCGRITMFNDEGDEWQSSGTRRITGTRQQRWRRGLMRVGDASRLYGLLRSDRLDGIIPDTAPEGWDHYTAAKIAVRGPVLKIEVDAMRRHQTAAEDYRRMIHKQERGWFGRMTFARHVLTLCRRDPEMKTTRVAGQLAMASYFTKHVAMNLPAGRFLVPVRAMLILLAYGIGGVAWILP